MRMINQLNTHTNTLTQTLATQQLAVELYETIAITIDYTLFSV